LTFAQAAEGGKLLMAGKGGIGDGERPYRKEEWGDPGALELALNEERLEDVEP
jgi:hypothetical protein